MTIKNLRKKIDEIDSKILALLNMRTKIAIQIGKIKGTNKKGYYVPQREKEILDKLIKNNKGPLKTNLIRDIFGEILSASRSLQGKQRIAYLGPESTFTHLAAIKNFGKNAEYVPGKSIKDVFYDVEKGRADYGVVPIENSTEGVVNHTLDMFVDSELKICAEILLEISHNILSREKSLKRIKKIYSHPQAIAQSRNWIEDYLPNAELIEVSSTSKAAEMAKRNRFSAAIASSFASQLYKLNIISRGIEDSPNNFTRFLIVGTEYPSRSGRDKSSIMFSIKDRVGALHDMLVPFKVNRINLTKIESRPSKRKAWEYIFFVDFVGHVDEKKIKMALRTLEKNCVFLRILGSYPRWE